LFKNLQQELDRLAKVQEVSVPIERDSDGFIDKECPAPECLFSFKVQGDDWTNLVRDEEVFCPSCGHAAPARSWFSSTQVEAAKLYAIDKIKNGINAAMRADAAESKRRQNRSSFLSITLDVNGGTETVLLPLSAAEPMRLRTCCESCGCRYSYVGAAYFCPSCGQNSASHTFSPTLTTIRTAAGLGPTLRATLDPDQAEVMVRALLEKAMQDAVMSFQRLNEQLYEKQTGNKARRNVFQRLDDGSNLWRAAIGVSYEQLLSGDELNCLRIYFQQRHLLSHQQGIVDQDYILRSNDSSYAVGQRLLIRDAVILQFADLIEKIAMGLMGRCRP
jgi:uncharacterized Zn finger protein (UPF0148 family)